MLAWLLHCRLQEKAALKIWELNLCRDEKFVMRTRKELTRDDPVEEENHKYTPTFL